MQLGLIQSTGPHPVNRRSKEQKTEVSQRRIPSQGSSFQPAGFTKVLLTRPLIMAHTCSSSWGPAGPRKLRGNTAVAI